MHGPGDDDDPFASKKRDPFATDGGSAVDSAPVGEPPDLTQAPTPAATSIAASESGERLAPVQPPEDLPEDVHVPTERELSEYQAAERFRERERAGPTGPDRLDRSPPHDDDAEASVLGALLLENACIADVGAILSGPDFYSEAHRLIFEAMAPLLEDGKEVDQLILREALRLGGNLDKVGGAEALIRLLDLVPTAANVVHYAKIVRRCALLREAIRVHDAGIRSAFENEDPDPVASIAAAGQRLLEVAHGSLPEKLEVFGAGDLLEMKLERPAPLIGDGLPSPMLSMGQLLVTAGPPKLGKTLLALDQVTKLAEGQGLWCDQKVHGPVKCLVIAKEGGLLLIQDNLSKMASLLSRESRNRIRIPDERHLREVNLSTPRGRLLLKKLIETEEPAIVLFDPFFRMHRANENDNREMGEILAFLEELRNETKAAHHINHHTSRATVENTKGKATHRSRGATVIEADADAIITLDHPDGDVADACAFMYWECRRGKAPPNYIVFRDEYLRHHVAPLGKRSKTKKKEGVSVPDLKEALKGGPKNLHQLAGAVGASLVSTREAIARLGFAVVRTLTKDGEVYSLAEGTPDKKPEQKGLPGVS